MSSYDQIRKGMSEVMEGVNILLNDMERLHLKLNYELGKARELTRQYNILVEQYNKLIVDNTLPDDLDPELKKLLAGDK